MLKGKRLSILGDSVSTYYGISNDAAANATTQYNPSFYFKRHFPAESTYWHIIMDKYGMSLCVNNSWSGGNLSGRDIDASGVNRANHLARDNGEAPDVIIVFMGLNDLGRNVPLHVFAEDYERTLMIIKEKYPSARVCCVNMPDRPGFLTERTAAINGIIEGAVKNAGEQFFIAHLFDRKFKSYDDFYMNTVDGLHPDRDGMRMIADAVAEAIDKSIIKST